MSIKKLDSQSISRISVNQVIIDLSICIKELLENSLDAGATKVEIITYDYGLGGIRVTDNGSGIDADNFALMAKKGATSKIEDFEDLERIQTYGFRGEALNAIAHLSDLQIITRTAKDENGWELLFDHDFNLTTKKIARRDEPGTEIYLKNLFRELPVRYQEFKSNYHQQFSKASSMVEAYALICTGVKITLVNSTKEKPYKNWEVVISNESQNAHLKDNILAVLGKKVFDSLAEVDYRAENLRFYGYATKTITSGSMHSSYKKDLTYFFVNKRPVNLNKKITNLLSQIYKQYNPGAKFIVILSIELPPNEYDINVTPDKREIIFKSPQFVYDSLKNCFEAFHENAKATSKTMVSPILPTKQIQLTFDVKEKTSENVEKTNKVNSSFVSKQNSQVDIDSQNRRRISGKGSFLLLRSVTLRKRSKLLKKRKRIMVIIHLKRRIRKKSPKAIINELFRNSNSSLVKDSGKIKVLPGRMNSFYAAFKGNKEIRTSSAFTPSTTKSEINKIEVESESNQLKENDNDNKKNDYKITELKITSLSLPTIKVEKPTCRDHQPNFKAMEHNSQIKVTELTFNPFNEVTNTQDASRPDNKSSPQSERLSESDDQCCTQEKSYTDVDSKPIGEIQNEKESSNAVFSDTTLEVYADNMSKCFQKNQFHEMYRLFLVGQFNFGFLVCILKDPRRNEIYIIDQHAADEKYNFEKLVREYKPATQKLVQPLNIFLSGSRASTLRENLDIIEKNGFKVDFSVQKDSFQSARITALPIARNTTFGEEDLNMLLDLIENNPYEKADIQIPKIKNILASKACRSSVMVGKALSSNHMIKIIHNLATLKSPWNCPHGRPTLITLGDFDTKKNFISKKVAKKPINIDKI